MKTNVAQTWPDEEGKRELPSSEEPLELAVLAKTWKDLEKSGAALLLPHPISQAAFALLPLLLLAVPCCYLWCGCCIFSLGCL